MTRREALASISAVVLAIAFKAIEFVMLPVRYRPDLLIVLAVSVGWACGFWMSFPVGFVLGLLEDLISGRAPGSRALSLALAAMTSSIIKRFVNPDSVLSKLISAILSTAVADVACFGVLRAMGIEIGLDYSIRMILPASVAWSALLILPVDSMVRRLSHFLGRLLPAKEDREREVPA